MTKRSIHVVPHEGGWAAEKEGAKRASFVGETKAKVESQARAQAKVEHVELFIHGRNGKIQDRDSFGNDPCPPKDSKQLALCKTIRLRQFFPKEMDLRQVTPRQLAHVERLPNNRP